MSRKECLRACVLVPFLSLVVIAIYAAGARPAQAYDTVGVNLTASEFFEADLSEVRWKADVTQFVNDPPDADALRIEFNSAGFAGSLGAMGMGVMIQNVLHEYPAAACAVEALPGGLELYFSVIDDLDRNPKLVAGIAQNAGVANQPPAFRRLFQDIDGLGIVGNNIYATSAIGDDRIASPVTIEWHLKRGGRITNPPGNLKKNIVCEWVSLQGEFREWMVSVTINGKAHSVATYYLPEAYASYLDPFSPLTFHQEHFQACDNRLPINETEVVYYDIRVRRDGDPEWISIPDWQINYSYDGGCAPAPSDLRHGLGTATRQGKKVLLSRSGHDNDLSLKRCDVENDGLFTCSQRILFSGIDRPTGDEAVTIGQVSVVPSFDDVTVSWETSRPATGMLRYGTSTELGSSVVAGAGQATQHSVSISGLSGGIYPFRVEAVDARGHLATYDGTFGAAGPCVRDESTACLLGERFEVKVDWRRSSGSGVARVMSFGNERAETDQSAFFYFSSASNFEMGLKILDACSINQRFWVFISGLTNQGWTVSIRDSETGAVKTYSNPVGHLTDTIADTSSGVSCL